MEQKKDGNKKNYTNSTPDVRLHSLQKNVLRFFIIDLDSDNFSFFRTLTPKQTIIRALCEVLNKLQLQKLKKNVKWNKKAIIKIKKTNKQEKEEERDTKIESEEREGRRKKMVRILHSADL